MDSLFFIASKVFWAIAQPDSLIVIVLALAAAMTLLNWIKWAKITTTTLALFLVSLGLYPLGDFVLAPLENSYAQPTNLAPTRIIVLGGGEDSYPSGLSQTQNLNEAGERFLTAIKLAHQFPNATLIFTGGSGNMLDQSISGTDIAKPIFDGFPSLSGRTLLEGSSRNTYENAKNTAQSLQSMGSDPTHGQKILVTSAYHMRRSMGVFCAADYRNMIPYPTDYRVSYRWDWDLANHLHDLNNGLREWIGLIAYRVTDKIDTLAPASC